MDEQKIILAVRSGDIEAYEQLVARYHVGLIIHCERLVGNRDDAEDITQEAFITAFSTLRQFDPTKGRFSTWLYRIATNKAIDYLRSIKRRVDVEDIDALINEAAPDYGTEESKHMVRQAVSKLRPSKYKQVIEAYYWRGQSYEQIAGELQVPVNTVRTWLRRAKQQLRSDLS